MKIIIPDMGHGNCIGIFLESLPPLVIDCGTDDANKVRNFDIVKRQIAKVLSRDLIITHYHFDHYSLLRTLHDGFFENIYLPALPKESQSAEAMLRFLALAISVQFREYYLTPMILSKGKNILCKVKGDSFKAAGRCWEVLWPDYQIIDEINRKKIKTILNKIEEVRERLSDKQLHEFNAWYDYLSKSFAKSKEPDRHPKEIAKNNESDEDVREALTSIEGIFKDITNRASLVVMDDLGDFLFTGDIDNTVLEKYLNFGNHSYFLVEAPHHGGYYGCAFENVLTEVLVISRKVNYKPNCEFFRSLSWRVLVDTARTGNCVVHSKGRRKALIICSNCNMPIHIYCH